MFSQMSCCFSEHFQIHKQARCALALSLQTAHISDVTLKLGCSFSCLGGKCLFNITFLSGVHLDSSEAPPGSAHVCRCCGLVGAILSGDAPRSGGVKSTEGFFILLYR